MALADYRRLLGRYDAMIHGEPWWDGRREALVREMDRLWPKLKPPEREAAVAHAQALYDRRFR